MEVAPESIEVDPNDYLPSPAAVPPQPSGSAVAAPVQEANVKISERATEVEAEIVGYEEEGLEATVETAEDRLRKDIERQETSINWH